MWGGHNDTGDKPWGQPAPSPDYTVPTGTFNMILLDVLPVAKLVRPPILGLEKRGKIFKKKVSGEEAGFGVTPPESPGTLSRQGAAAMGRRSSATPEPL